MPFTYNNYIKYRKWLSWMVISANVFLVITSMCQTPNGTLQILISHVITVFVLIEPFQQIVPWSCYHILVPSSTGGGGRYTQISLNFECVAWRAENRGLENRLSPNFRSLRTEFLSHLRLLKLKFDKILGLTELFLDFETLNANFQKKCDFRWILRSGTENFWNGCLNKTLIEQSGRCEKEVLEATTHFQVSTPSPPTFSISSVCFQLLYYWTLTSGSINVSCYTRK